jgi:Endonuclease/Exonuclease/phosphatase family
LNPKAKETPMLQDAVRQRMLAGLALGFVAAAALPASARAEQVRFATFNASLNRSFAGELIFDLSAPDNEQAQAVAEIIQRVNPDVLLLNEFDFDLGGAAISLFQENYLSVSQNGAQPVEYPFVFFRPSNTGIASGFDLDNDGEIVRDPNAPGYGEDALGFGAFAAQFAMVLLSKFPIKEEAARTFQLFLWKDMPGALLPSDPATGESWYSPEELEVFRLSSKNHRDVPIQIGSRVVHVLASHPTPPVFDGPEDRNGKRNHDEIRLWADYVVPRRSGYIVDDQGSPGGLGWNDSFVVMGDQNADPNDGDSVAHAIRQLLDLKRVNTKVTPMSEGGIEADELQNAANDSHETPAATDTADFADEPPASGNLRVDYVLPSRDLKIINAGVFWPTTDDPLFPLVVESSDHRLVWVDLMIER